MCLKMKMFDGLTKSKFYTKCKSLTKTTKIRLEASKKRKNLVAKRLKNDMTNLLKHDFDDKAFCLAQELMAELNMIACYDFIEQFCGCISSNLSVMSEQRECPEECREAVQSLICAAARFSEFPELRDLRSLFTERYKTSLESFINKKFVETLRPKPATKEMKLQLMHDIAQEFSIDWNAKSLEQKLFKPPADHQDLPRYGSLGDIVDVPKRESQDDDGYELKKDKADIFKRRDGHDLGNRRNKRRNIGNKRPLKPPPGRKEIGSTGATKNSSAVDRDSSNRKPYPKPPPSWKINKDTGEVTKPRSTKSEITLPPGKAACPAGATKRYTGAASLQPAHVHPKLPNYEELPARIAALTKLTHELKKDKADIFKRRDGHDLGNRRNKGRNIGDKRPLKPPPGRKEVGSTGATKNSSAVDRDSSNLKPYPKPPPSWKINKDTGEVIKPRSTKSEITLPPGKAACPAGATKRYTGAASLQPAHVHPKLPNYEELPARIAALTKLT